MILSYYYFGQDELKTMAVLADRLHCPMCTAAFSSAGLATAFWRGDDTVYFCLCGSCGWRGDVVDISRVSSWEKIEELHDE